MSRLLLQPATWPHLNLNPEPMGISMDPDSIQRWYQELFRDQEPGQNPEPTKVDIHAFIKNRWKPRPPSQPYRYQGRL